jgi:hypothetical protein
VTKKATSFGGRLFVTCALACAGMFGSGGRI